MDDMRADMFDKWFGLSCLCLVDRMMSVEVVVLIILELLNVAKEISSLPSL